MGARRLGLGLLMSVCALVCVAVAGVGPAWAAGGSFKFGPFGSEAGQLAYPQGMAINQHGEIYVGENDNDRVSKFDASGNFLLAWGSGVLNGAEEAQTCTTSCLDGRSSNGAGGFCSPEGVAVDSDPLSASYNDVYVGESCQHRVQKFGPSGEFLLAFGGHVNARTGEDVCTASEISACQQGTEGTGNGEFSSYSAVAIGPGGDVYVGDKARVEVFLSSGVWKENISLSSLSSEGSVVALAVNPTGDVYVKDTGVPGVREFEPNGTEMSTRLDEAGGETVRSITLDSSGDVFLSENNESTPCTCDFLKFSPTGQELDSFGGKSLVFMTSAVAFDNATEELYVYGDNDPNTEDIEYGHYGVWAFAVPAPGPVIGLGSENGTPEPRGAAKFEVTVDPQGNSTMYHVEYVDEKSFDEGGYVHATSTTPQSLGSSFVEEHVEIHLPAGTLVPGTTYHWRVVAVDSSNRTSTGPDQSFQETPPAMIEGPWASNVAATSTTLSAKINPLGANTSYRLEYGTSTSYGHVLTGNVGEGMGNVTVSYHIQELQGETLYHYRLVTTSEVGTVETVDHTFMTQIASGSELRLSDGRAWELVSPPNKKAALIGPSSFNYWLTQAASDGSGITYTTNDTIGEDAVGHLFSSQVLSTRVAGVWRTQYVSESGGLPPEGESAKGMLDSSEYWPVFSQNLSLGMLEPGSGPTKPQSPEAAERTLYLRDSSNGSFRPLETQTNVPQGLKVDELEGSYYFAATPDFSHVVFGTPAALTPEAVKGSCEGCYISETMNLYEWYNGQLQLVNIFPDGSTKAGAAVGNAEMGTSKGEMIARAISNDGRWVVWKYQSPGSGATTRLLYARDMVDKHTVELGGSQARFQAMSSDGSKIFFTEGELEGDLYVFDTETGTQTDLTADHGSVEPNAGVQNAVMGASQDGSYIYFVATGVLAGKAVSGADNLYLLHDGTTGWTTTLIATLSEEDKHTWGGDERPGKKVHMNPWLVDSEVSPDGRYVAFMSNSSLTGYDNHDAVSGQPDEEVFLYDAVSNHLVCASCNPTGSRPVGVFDNGGESGAGYESLLVDTTNSWSAKSSGSNHWLAGSLVGWNNTFNRASYQPRYVMDNGRLFFNSPDALVPQDTNGLEDVYEYEPNSVGSCAPEQAVFSETSGGCVSLISSGTSATESAFMDASETGDDVFFVAANKLTFEDYDNAYDMYDAHVCTEAVPCRADPVSPPECTSGDSCKAAPSPQPAIFGATPSATFNGVGNLAPSSGSSVTPRSLTRAQKLAGALKACHEKKNRKKRAACERQARKRYGARQTRKAKTTAKGNG